ncbi:peroxidase 60 [Tanacetum coccineum]
MNVKGCDASLLLDGTNSEKTAPPNLSIRGFDVIDVARDAVERVYPGVVSCADIIVLATRDVISFSGGGRYSVQTGRRDGFASLAQNTAILPSPFESVSNAIQVFANKGFTTTEMIYLLGNSPYITISLIITAVGFYNQKIFQCDPSVIEITLLNHLSICGHTVGITHCSLFKDRLYNFQNTGKPDPTMDSSLLISLRSRCPQNASVDGTANLDQNPMSSWLSWVSPKFLQEQKGR